MGHNIWVSSDNAERYDEEHDCQCEGYPACRECGGTGVVVYNRKVNSYPYSYNVPQWLRNATSRYYSQLTHNQCHSLACEIQERIDNGETMMTHFAGEDELIDKLPMFLNMFKALAKEAKELDCLVYMD